MATREPNGSGDHGETVAAECINNGTVCKCCLVPFKDTAPGSERVCDLCWEAAGVVDGELDTGGEEE